MSVERIRALSATYAQVAQMLAADGLVGPALAHREAADLLGQAAVAMDFADRAANGPAIPQTPLALTEMSDGSLCVAAYQPISGLVAVMLAGGIVSFTEEEASWLCRIIGDALDDAAAARRMAAEEREVWAA